MVRRGLRVLGLLVLVPSLVMATWSAGVLLVLGASPSAAGDAWWLIYGMSGIYGFGVVLPTSAMMRPRYPAEWWRFGVQHALLAFLVTCFVVLYPVRGLLPVRTALDVVFLMLAVPIPAGVFAAEFARRMWPPR